MNSILNVSARNHAGMILMTVLAQSLPGEFVTLQEVANYMGLSQGYLEEIARDLKKAKLIRGRKGPGGGYQLASPAQKITAKQILVALEGPIVPVECGSACPVASRCSSKTVWTELRKEMEKSLNSMTLDKIIT